MVGTLNIRMCLSVSAMIVMIVIGRGVAGPVVEIDPNALAPEQKDVLNYAYLTLRPDLLPAIKATGDQRIVVRQARLKVIYIVSLERTNQGEARIWASRGTSPGMVKFILEEAARVRAVLTDEQRQAFVQLMADQKLEPVTVDATSRHFLLRYTFGPNDRVEQAKTSDGRVLDIVVPEKEEPKEWFKELTTGDELVRLMENPDWQVRKPVGDWLIKRGSGGLDADAKKHLAELILAGVESGGAPDAGFWMQAYSHVAQAGQKQRVLALLEKCSIHHLAGHVAAYAAVAPSDALNYLAKPNPDGNFRIRAVQGLGMAPDGLKLLQSAKTKMPDMKWKIDNEIKAVTELANARAQGLPEDPGEAAALKAKIKARQEEEERVKSGKKPSDYQGFDDWFADLSSRNRDTIEKAMSHFETSVHAVDLSKVTPSQREAVFKIVYEGVASPKTIMSRDRAGRLLVASAEAKQTDLLVALIRPEQRDPQYALAALMRANPDKAQEVLLAIEGDSKLRFTLVRNAAALVPVEAIVVLERTLPKLKHKNTVDSYQFLIADLKNKSNAR